MIPIYDRVYYTIYRMILRLASMFSMATDLPRTRVVLILAIIHGISFIAVFGVLSAITGTAILIDSRTKTVIAAGVIIALNFFLIFYRDRYKKVEAALSLTWSREKNKNIFITVAYIIITAVFVWLSIRYVMNHTFEN